MADPARRYKYLGTLVDGEGEESTVIVWGDIDPGSYGVPDIDGFSQTIMLAVAACSNARLKTYGWAREFVNSLELPTPDSTESYPNIEDKAFVVLQAETDGSIFELSVPAPVDACFLSDGETVDPTASPMSDLLDTLLGYRASTKGGGVPLTYIKGFLRRSKTRRRVRQGIATERGG